MYLLSHVNKSGAGKLPSLATKVHSCSDCKIYVIVPQHYHRTSNLLHRIKTKYL